MTTKMITLIYNMHRNAYLLFKHDSGVYIYIYINYYIYSPPSTGILVVYMYYVYTIYILTTKYK